MAAEQGAALAAAVQYAVEMLACDTQKARRHCLRNWLAGFFFAFYSAVSVTGHTMTLSRS